MLDSMNTSLGYSQKCLNPLLKMNRISVLLKTKSFSEEFWNSLFKYFSFNINDRTVGVQLIYLRLTGIMLLCV